MLSQQQPTPFEIVTGPDGMRVASNGRLRLTVLDPRGKLFRRRAIRGIAAKPAAEVLLPQINALAGELLASPGLTGAELQARLHAIAGTLVTEEPRRVEWAVAELAGVRVYVDGETVIVTTLNLEAAAS